LVLITELNIMHVLVFVAFNLKLSSFDAQLLGKYFPNVRQFRARSGTEIKDVYMPNRGRFFWYIYSGIVHVHV